MRMQARYIGALQARISKNCLGCEGARVCRAKDNIQLCQLGTADGPLLRRPVARDLRGHTFTPSYRSLATERIELDSSAEVTSELDRSALPAQIEAHSLISQTQTLRRTAEPESISDATS